MFQQLFTQIESCSVMRQIHSAWSPFAAKEGSTQAHACCEFTWAMKAAGSTSEHPVSSTEA